MAVRIVNNTVGKQWFDQRDNDLVPSGACNVTAYRAALSAANWPELPRGKYAQCEDNFLDFIRTSPQVQQRYKQIQPNKAFPPEQIHELLCLGANLWLEPLKGPEIILRWNLRLNDITQVLDNGGAVVMSGRFYDHKAGEIGHIITVVGYVTDESGKEVTTLLIDDSWGDYRDLYKTRAGASISMPVADFMSQIREQDNPVKFGHVVPRYERRS